MSDLPLSHWLPFAKGVNRDTAIVLLPLEDRVKTALVDAGFLTVGQLEDRSIGPNGANGRLTAIRGIRPTDEMAIERVIYGIFAEKADDEPVSTIHDDG